MEMCVCGGGGGVLTFISGEYEADVGSLLSFISEIVGFLIQILSITVNITPTKTLWALLWYIISKVHDISYTNKHFVSFKMLILLFYYIIKIDNRSQFMVFSLQM
jgi:hypothetical protein